MNARLAVATAAALALGAVADLLVGADLPGYTAVFSLAGCILIIVASKWLGKKLLQRREAFYEESPGAG